MKHEKIVKRKDGTQYRIEVELYLFVFDAKAEYKVEVRYRPKGKRNWLPLEEEIFAHEYARLSKDEQLEYDQRVLLKYVTQEEINEAKIELWNLLKPEV